MIKLKITNWNNPNSDALRRIQSIYNLSMILWSRNWNVHFISAHRELIFVRIHSKFDMQVWQIFHLEHEGKDNENCKAADKKYGRYPAYFKVGK